MRKNMKTVTVRIGMMAICLAALSFIIPQTAMATLGAKNCTITSDQDNVQLIESIRSVESSFNKGTGPNDVAGIGQGCKAMWWLATDSKTITISKPIVIKGSVTPGSTLVIEGNEHTIKVSSNFVAAEGQACAIIVDSPNVVIRNLFIDGQLLPTQTATAENATGEAAVPTAIDGICMNKTQSRLEGVIVTKMPGRGIVVNGLNNIIKGSTLEYDYKFSRDDGDYSIFSSNVDVLKVNKTDGKIYFIENNVPVLDEYATATIDANGNPVKDSDGRLVLGKGMGSVKHPSGAYENGGIGIEVMNNSGTTYNRVEPQLVLFSNGNGKELQVTPSEISVTLAGNGGNTQYSYHGKITKNGSSFAPVAILVFKKQGSLDLVPTDIKTEDVLVGYILRDPTNKGIFATIKSGGITNGNLQETGRYNFTLNATDYDNRAIYVVVYQTEDQVASTSTECMLSGKSQKCGDEQDECTANADCPVGYVCSMSKTCVMDAENSAGDETHLWDLQACNKEREDQGSSAYAYPVDKSFDSDDDGIADGLEDLSMSCVGEKPAETDLRDPDTDKDGVLDGVEDANQNGFVDCYMPFDSREDLKTVECGDDGTAKSAACLTDACKVICEKVGTASYYLVEPDYYDSDTIGWSGKKFIPKLESFSKEDHMNGVPKGYDKSLGYCTETNPRYADSDQDSISDGQEDYPKGLKIDKTTDVAYLYYMASSKDHFIGDPVWVNDSENTGSLKKVSCTDMVKDSVLGKIAIYRWKHPDQTEASLGAALSNVVCEYEKVHNNLYAYNGSYDKGMGETDPKLFDTDHDGYCDGSGCQDFYSCVVDPAASAQSGGLYIPFVTGLFNEASGDVCMTRDGTGEKIKVKGQDFCPTIFAKDNKCPEECYNGKFEVDLAGKDITKIKELLGKHDMASMEALKAMNLKDSDNDQIPDVVENPEGLNDSTRTCAASVRGFSAFATDTIEGMCQQSNASAATNELCKSTLAFDGTEGAILFCYLDRDGDELKDCQEDLNGDGKYTKATAFYVGALGLVDRSKWESNPLVVDSDTDGINDKQELENGSNPGNIDTDSDNMSDKDEVARTGGIDDVIYSPTNISTSEYTCEELVDTDPANQDTDGDGFKDGDEVNRTHTNPTNADSDNDGACDGPILVGDCTKSELSQLKDIDQDNPVSSLLEKETDPCNANMDEDEFLDGEDDNPRVKSNGNNIKLNNCGNDADADGLPDNVEAMLNTMPNEDDSDGDGLVDGCRIEGTKRMGELCNSEKTCYSDIQEGAVSSSFITCTTIDSFDCDTEPMNPDTDGDGVTDGKERLYGGERGRTWDKKTVVAAPINPRKKDTDGDCIEDGLENKNGDEKWDYNETLANSYDPNFAWDTDGDMLSDGNAGDGLGEDMDCNGSNVCEGGAICETSPLNPNSDNMDGSDYEDLLVGGVGNALDGKRNGGCSMAGGSGDYATMILFGMMALAVRIVRRRVKA